MVMTDSLNTTPEAAASWQNDFLKEQLHKGPVQVLFIKKDGTERKMLCTLNPDLMDLLPQEQNTIKPARQNPDVLAVWDIENQGWRSFRWDSIIGFTEA